MNLFYRHAYDIGFGFAALLWPFFRKRRRISVDNILRAKITDDPREALRIARHSFCHFSGHIFEAIFVRGVINNDNWREHVTLCENENFNRVLFERTDTPIVIVSGHHGCWEAATNIVPFRRPMIAIARIMDNRLLARWMKKYSFRGNVTVVSKNDGFSRKVMDQWFETKAGMTILCDQYAHGGARVKFFGRPAPTVTSAMRLAIRYGYPVIVGSFIRTGPCRYLIVGGEPRVFPKDADRNEAVQWMNDRLEECIRRYPEQYLWMHRRWRDD